MRHRLLLPLGAMALMLLCAPVPVAGQAPAGTATFDPTTTNTEEAIDAAVDPDLQGVWFMATYTPLERPAELGDKAFYTEEEALAAFKYAVESDARVDKGTGEEPGY